MITIEDALRALGFTQEQIEEEAPRTGSATPPELGPEGQSRAARDPWWSTLYPLTIEVGPNNVVPGFKPGDRIRLVRVKENANGMVQLTPQDVLAIGNLSENGGDYEPQTETEQVWRMILATLETFPGSRLLPS